MKRLILSLLTLISLNVNAGLITFNKVTSNTSENFQSELSMWLEQGSNDNTATLKLINELSAGVQISRVFFAGNTEFISPVPPVDIQLLTPTFRQNDSELILNYPGDKKVDVIKKVRLITGLGLKESKDLVDKAPSIIPLSAGYDFEAAAKELNDAGADTTINYGDLTPLLSLDVTTENIAIADLFKSKLILNSPGGAKLSVVKVVKELTGLGLKESKDLVDNSPSVIDLPHIEMETAAKRLMEAGADITIASSVLFKPNIEVLYNYHQTATDSPTDLLLGLENNFDDFSKLFATGEISLGVEVRGNNGKELYVSRYISKIPEPSSLALFLISGLFLFRIKTAKL